MCLAKVVQQKSKGKSDYFSPCAFEHDLACGVDCRWTDKRSDTVVAAKGLFDKTIIEAEVQALQAASCAGVSRIADLLDVVRCPWGKTYLVLEYVCHLLVLLQQQQSILIAGWLQICEGHPFAPVQ